MAMVAAMVEGAMEAVSTFTTLTFALFSLPSRKHPNNDSSRGSNTLFRISLRNTYLWLTRESRWWWIWHGHADDGWSYGRNDAGRTTVLSPKRDLVLDSRSRAKGKGVHGNGDAE